MSISKASELEKHFIQGRFLEILTLINDQSFRDLDYQEFMDFAYLKLQIMYIRKQFLEGLNYCSDIISKIKMEDKLSKIRFSQMKCSYLIQVGKLSEAFKIIEENYNKLLDLEESDSEFAREEQIQNRIIRSHYLIQKQDLDLALNYLNEAKHLLNEDDNLFTIFEVYLHIARILSNVGNDSQAHENLTKWEETYLDKNNQFYVALTQLERGKIYESSTDPEKAYEYFLKAEKIEKELDNIDLTWIVLHTLGVYYINQGEISESKIYNKKLVKVAKKLQSEGIKTRAFNNLASAYYFQGDPDVALEYLFYCLSINEKIGDPKQISTSYNNIAVNYRLKGEYDRALDYLNKSLTIDKSLKDERRMASSLVNIGQVYYLKGELEEAKKYYMKCLPIDEKYGNKSHIAETVYNLLTLSLEQDDVEQASEYFGRLDQLHEESDNKIINLRFRLGKMHLLKVSKRSRNQAKAQEILIDIINEDPIDFELYVSAMYNLCDLLLLELKLTGEDEILTEIKELVERLQNYAEIQQSYSIFAETYLIKSRIALLEFKLDEAQNMLNAAEQLANEKHLEKLAMKVSAYHDQLLDQMATFEKMKDEETTLTDRLDEARLEEFFSQRAPLEEIINVPEEPLMFLIIKEGGTTLYKYNFRDDSRMNEELIAGLFSALYTLSDEVFHTEADIQRIKHQDYTIILKSENEILICYVFNGQSYSAVQKMERFLETLVKSSTVWEAVNRPVNYLTESEKIGMDLIVSDLFIEDNTI